MMTLSIVRLYHDLLGTYGDQGNAEVLVHRTRGRGLAVELVEVTPGAPVPASGNIYLLGGGEDGPQAVALEMLRTSGNLNRAVDQGAAVLAVCAGFQLIGTELPDAQGNTVVGVGLVDAVTTVDKRPRSVGELVVATRGDLGVLTGFENHQGVTQLGEGYAPLGDVVSGCGNGMPSQTTSRPEGVRHGAVIGTYMHGPVLARNPQLADAIIESVVGPVLPFIDEYAENFAAERRRTLTR